MNIVNSAKLRANAQAKARVKFAIPISTSRVPADGSSHGIHETDVSTCTLFFLSLQSQLRMYHWQTKSFARHKATEKLISRIVELSDAFIEVHMGAAGGTRPIAAPLGTGWNLKNINDDEILEYLDSVAAFMTAEIPRHVHHLSNLLNIRDEMLAVVNQTQYLFTLA